MQRYALFGVLAITIYDDLHILSPTMRTNALVAQGTATIATSIAHASITEIAPKGKPDVNNQQRIAHIDERGKAEDHVIDSTDTHQAKIIHQLLGWRQVLVKGEKCSERHYHNCPYRAQEDAQMKGNGEGIECGMIVEMTPRFCILHLDGTVEHGR